MSFRSLRQSVARVARSRPELLAFVPLAAVTAVSRASGHRRVHIVSKSMLMPTLQAGLVARGAGWPLLAATAAGWLGDVLLLPSGAQQTAVQQRRQLRSGAVAFGVQQVGYCAMMLRAGARPSGRRIAAVVPWLGALSVLDTVKGDACAPDPIITTYGILLGAMTTLAWSSGRLPMQAGGVLFLASDSVILIREQLLKNTTARACAEAFVLGTYAAAQALLVGELEPISR